MQTKQDQEDFLSQLAAEADEAPTVVPTEASTTQLRTLAVELIETQAEAAALEEKLKAKNVRVNDLQYKLIPEMMDQIRQDRMGLPDFGEFGADLVSSPYYHANIVADWPEEKRDAAFKLLDRMGAGDVVKNVVTLSFGRGMDKLQSAFRDALRDPDFEKIMRRHGGAEVNDYELPPVETARSVPWNTLTAFVKEMIEKGRFYLPWMIEEKVDPKELLGATVGTVAKIKYRKK